MPPEAAQATTTAATTAETTTPAAAPATDNRSTKLSKQAEQRARLQEKAATALGFGRSASTETESSPASTLPSASSSAPAATTQQAAAAIEQQGGSVPNQRPTESDGAYKQRLDQVLVKLQETEGSLLTERTTRETLEREYNPLKSRLAAAREAISKGDRNAAHDILDLIGTSFDDLLDDAKTGKLKKPTLRAKLDPETQAMIERGEKAAKELEERKAEEKRQKDATEAQAKAKTDWDADVAYTKGQLEQLKEQHPMFAALPNAAERLVPELRAAHAQAQKNGTQLNVGEVIASASKRLLGDLEATLMSGGVVKGLSQATKDFLAQQLGLKPAAEQGKPGSPKSEAAGKGGGAGGPRTLTQSATEEIPAYQARKQSEREKKGRLNDVAKTLFRK